jgi:hypothetical protein
VSIQYFTGLIVIILTFHTYKAASQIIITENDIASAGDSILVSIPNNINNYNFTDTGADFFWDFSGLQYATQRFEAFLSVFRTSITYSLFFADIPFSPNRANMAQETILPLPAIISSSDSYNFFFKNDNVFKQVGIGATLNGIETPIPFDEHDVIYRFPLQYGDADTSDSEYDFNLPNFVYYHMKQRRINEIDGWGRLVTPLDTFDVLRVKTTISGSDSLYIDSLNIGITLPRPREIQYKWLAPGRKIPVLQINTRSGFGNTFVTGAFYQDSAPAPDTTTIRAQRFTRMSMLKVFPNPARHQIVAECLCHDIKAVSMIDVSGNIILPHYVADKQKVTISLPDAAPGILPGHYLLKIETNEQVLIAQVFVIP